MPAGLPVKSKSAVPLPTLPPKVDTPPTKVETTKTEPPKKNEPVNVGFGGSGGDSGGGGVGKSHIVGFTLSLHLSHFFFIQILIYLVQIFSITERSKIAQK